MSFYIKNIEIKGRVILAPMAGITSFSYRKNMKKFGCSLTYTEMISDCGLLYNNKNTFELLKSDGSDRPLAVQLFGGDTETLLKGLKVLEDSGFEYDILDLNLACPVPKVVRNNGGSKWLVDLDKMYEMVKSIVKASKKPVTCKVRLGYSTIKIVDICKTLEKAGCSFIAIHARTRNEYYSGEPHFEELKDLKNKISIPFGVSGNIFSVKDALKALEITKADAVLVARGSEGNPELITNINKALNGEMYDETKDIDRQLNYLKELANDMVFEFGEVKAMKLLRGIGSKYLDNIPNMKQYKIRMTKELNMLSDLDNLIKEIKNNSF